MLSNILVFLLGILLSLFIFWKRLREDYSTDLIFSSIFTILITVSVGLFISSKFFPAWFFWAGLAGGFFGLTIAIYRNKIRFYESLEALTFSLIPALSLLFLHDAVQNSSLFSFIAFVVTLLLIFIFYFVDSHYKNFSWYRSGKIGLSGLAVLFFLFLIRSAVASFVPSVLSFSGKFEAGVSGFFAILVGCVIYFLGKTQK